MLEILMILAALIGIAILGVLVVAAMRPNTFRIARSITISAPADKIFPLVNDPKAMNGWSPFVKTDPSMRIAYSGPASGRGAAFDWDSTGRGGKGRIEVTDASPSSSVGMSLVMSKPFACDNQIRFDLAPAAGDATSVTWAMSGPWPYLHRVMGTIFNSDKMVGGEFEKGLRDLKAIAERA